MKNVFIEGIQGMGKSTLINGIYEKVPEFHICREGDYSPIDLAWCTWMSQDDYDTVLKKYTPIQDEIKKIRYRKRDILLLLIQRLLQIFRISIRTWKRTKCITAERHSTI